MWDDDVLRRTVARLRQVQGDATATRATLAGFVREGLDAGLSLDEVVSALAVGHDSVIGRVPYSQGEKERVLTMLRELNVFKLLAGEDD